MPTLPDLQPLTDDQLRELIETANSLLAQRRKDNQEKAIAQAKDLLAAAGLSLSDLAQGKSAPRKRASQPLKQGQRFVNPDDGTQVYVVGKGRRPKWFAALEAKGQTPAPEPAAKKT